MKLVLNENGVEIGFLMCCISFPGQQGETMPEPEGCETLTQLDLDGTYYHTLALVLDATLSLLQRQTFGLQCKPQNTSALGLSHNLYWYSFSSNSPCDLLLCHVILWS